MGSGEMGRKKPFFGQGNEHLMVDGAYSNWGHRNRCANLLAACQSPPPFDDGGPKPEVLKGVINDADGLGTTFPGLSPW